MQAESHHRGYGGIIASQSTIRAIWVRAGALFRLSLQDVYDEASMRIREHTRSAQAAADASTDLLAIQAAAEGLLAESQLLAHPDLMVGKAKFIRTHARPRQLRYLDPLTHVEAKMLLPTCIAWKSHVDPMRIEESPLLEALMCASEEQQFSRDHGGVHFAMADGPDVPIWQVGAGARVVTRQDVSLTAH